MDASAALLQFTSIPIPRTRLIGREAERSAAGTFLLEDAVPLLTLTGPGGVGKTHLALAIAADVAPRFADSVVWVDLASLTDPELVVTTVAAILSVTPGADQSIMEALIVHLRPKQCLLLFDNCEHLLPAIGALVAALLAACPALQVFTTSRAPLRIRGEQILPLPPLAVPRSGAPLREMCVEPAVVLFSQRAQAVHPQFALTEQNAAAVTEICQRLDGLPLAIELAAARSNVLSPAALQALLSQRLQVIGPGPRDAPPRHHSIHDVIAWSYHLLTPHDRAVFRRVSVFAGGWTLEAASVVCELSLPEMLARLEVLVDQSLIVPHTAADAPTPRFTMLETIREFALEQLAGSPEGDDARDRHAEFFRDMISSLDLVYAFPGDATWLVRVAPEEANLRQALEHFLARADSHSLSTLSSGLTPFWITRSQSIEGLHWLESAISDDQDLPAILRVQCRYALGFFLLLHGDPIAAEPFIEESVASARACRDLPLLRHVLQTAGHLALERRDFKRAMALHEEAEQTARAVEMETPYGGLYVGVELCRQGLIAQDAGDTATALARFAAGIPYLRAPGGVRRLGMMLGELGIIQLMNGNLHDAASHLIESVALTWNARYESALARSLRGVSAVAAVTDQVVAGALLLGAADAMNANTPSFAAHASRERDLSAWTRAHMTKRLDPSVLDRETRKGTLLEINQAVAISREVLQSVLGGVRVDEIWQATGVPDPGHLPEGVWADLALAGDPASMRCERPSVVVEPLAALTNREQDVLSLLCQRLTNAEIASQLYISRSTVATHVEHLLAKLGATNRREAAAIAVRHSLV